MFYIPTSFLENILKEDIPWNDSTTEALGISGVPGKISCFPKKDGFVSGIEIGVRLFKEVGLEVTCIGKDGDFYSAGQTVLEARGTPKKSIPSIRPSKISLSTLPESRTASER